PLDFMASEEVLSKVNDTIQRLMLINENDKRINSLYSEFAIILDHEMSKTFEQIKTKPKGNNHKFFKKPYWNEELQKQWNMKKESESLWLNCKESAKKRNLKELYCIERRHFDKLHRKYKRNYQQKEQLNLLELSNKANSQDFWKYIGKLGIAQERKQELPWEVTDPEGNNSIRGHQNVLNAWAKTYEQLYSTVINNEEFDEDHYSNIKRAVTQIDQQDSDENNPMNNEITIEEVATAVGRAKLRKAAGVDNI
ncbi:unnamed protein product, partial [Owenia fusiformis]